MKEKYITVLTSSIVLGSYKIVTIEKYFLRVLRCVYMYILPHFYAPIFTKKNIYNKFKKLAGLTKRAWFKLKIVPPKIRIDKSENVGEL